MTAIDNLLNLFQIDTQVRGLRGRVESAQRQVSVHTRQLQELQQQLAEAQTRRKHLLATIGNLEGEIRLIDQRIEKFRTDLGNSTNKKQYDAVLSELEGAKKSKKTLEERVLKEMEQVEQFDGQLADLQKRADDRQRVCTVAAQELKQRRADVSDRLTELERQREAAAAIVPAAELELFNELCEIHDGQAMAPVEEIDRRNREYACGACNMHIQFNLISLLAGAAGAVVRCSACGRILYLQDETRGTLARK
jgi:hypothetical protein